MVCNQMEMLEKDQEIERLRKAAYDLELENKRLQKRLDEIHAITGVIYLVELPADTVPTDVPGALLKVGLTTSGHLGRVSSYGSNRFEHRLVRLPVYRVPWVEAQLKKLFRSLPHVELVQGQEYFKGDRDDILGAFDRFMEDLQTTTPELRHLPPRRRILRAEKVDGLPELPDGYEIPPWRPEFRPTPDNESFWDSYEGDDADGLVRTFERVQCAARLLRVAPERVDERFYCNFVTDKTVSQALRLREVLTSSFEETDRNLRERLASIPENEFHRDIQEWAMKKTVILQLLAQKYFETVLTDEDYAKLKRLEDVIPSRRKSVAYAEATISSFSEQEAKNFRRLLGYKGNLEGKRPIAFVNAILRNNIGLVVEQSKTKMTTAPSYDKLRLSLKQWRSLKSDYQSTLFDI